MNEAKQLSEVAKVLAWEAPYQASLAKRAASVIAERDALKVERGALRTEIEHLRAVLRDYAVSNIYGAAAREALGTDIR